MRLKSTLEIYNWRCFVYVETGFEKCLQREIFHVPKTSSRRRSPFAYFHKTKTIYNTPTDEIGDHLTTHSSRRRSQETQTHTFTTRHTRTQAQNSTHTHIHPRLNTTFALEFFIKSSPYFKKKYDDQTYFLTELSCHFCPSFLSIWSILLKFLISKLLYSVLITSIHRSSSSFSYSNTIFQNKSNYHD